MTILISLRYIYLYCQKIPFSKYFVIAVASVLVWGPPRGGEVPVPMFHWKMFEFSLLPQNQNLNFLCFLLPRNYLCSPVPFIFRLVFSCSPEINDIISLFPRAPWRASYVAAVKRIRILRKSADIIYVSQSFETVRIIHYIWKYRFAQRC